MSAPSVKTLEPIDKPDQAFRLPQALVIGHSLVIAALVIGHFHFGHALNFEILC